MTIGRKIGAGFGLALALLAILGGLAYWSTTRLIATSQSVERTQDVLGELGTLLTLVQDVETAYRGYLLTGDETFLQPYRDAQVRIDNTLQRLRELTAENAAQGQRLSDLRPLIDKK